MNHLNQRIEGKIDAKSISIGKGVIVEAGVEITGKDGPAESVVLGDFSYIGHGTRIRVPEFSIGDYTKLHANSFVHGGLPMQIGRNCWIGGATVLDSMGGLDIDDNVGIGASSQLWTHIQFGDIIEGSRFHSHNYMHVEKDAWFVGHCIVSPVRVGERSMALVGSVITKDMEPNHVYGGTPAKDLTHAVGPQFEERSVDDKARRLNEMIGQFAASYPQYAEQLHVVKDMSDLRDGITNFDVSTRQYTKTYSEAEVAFLKANVPLVKFTPVGEGPFVVPQGDSGTEGSALAGQ